MLKIKFFSGQKKPGSSGPLLSPDQSFEIGLDVFKNKFSNYEIDEDRGVLIAKAFIGVDGPDTIRYARKRRTVTEAKNTEIDLGDFAVYTTKLGIGVTYQVKILYLAFPNSQII